MPLQLTAEFSEHKLQVLVCAFSPIWNVWADSEK